MVSGGIFEANANNTIKCRAHMTLSTATPAAITDGEMRRAFDIATKLRAAERENKNQQSYNLIEPRR